MQTFWELLRTSTIIQAIVTLILVSTICYLYINERPVPDTLFQLAGIVVGFWLGQKSQQIITAELDKQEK